MPISIKQSGINVKNGSEYNNLGAFFLGDISGEVDDWLARNNPIGYTSPELFGAVGDGVTDDTQAWKDCIATGKIIVATKQYLCSEPLELDNSTYIFGTIINNTTDGVKIRGKSGKTYYINVSASREDRTKQFIGCEVINLNVCTIRCKTVNFYKGLQLTGDGTGCCYNIFEFVYTANPLYSVYLTAKNSGWCNENYFYNLKNINWTDTAYSGQAYGITLNKESSVTNGINSNHFINMCFEGSYCAINVVNGLDNTFENIRTEGCDYAAIFGSQTTRNMVWCLHGASAKTDEGTSNLVATNQSIINLFS